MKKEWKRSKERGKYSRHDVGKGNCKGREGKMNGRGQKGQKRGDGREKRRKEREMRRIRTAEKRREEDRRG